jgi:hypothetical protein
LGFVVDFMKEVSKPEKVLKNALHALMIYLDISGAQGSTWL